MPHNTKFDIERGRRKQSGRYKIVVTNEHGEDMEHVEIVFMGPPSSPMGNWHICNYHAGSRNLSSMLYTVATCEDHKLYFQAHLASR